MSDRKNGGFEDSLRRDATASVLINQTQDKLGGALRKIHDPAAHQECLNAGHFLYSASNRISADIPDEYRLAALVRIMLEDIMDFRKRLIEAEDNDDKDQVDIRKFLSEEFITCFYEVAREAEFLINNRNRKD